MSEEFLSFKSKNSAIRRRETEYLSKQYTSHELYTSHFRNQQRDRIPEDLIRDINTTIDAPRVLSDLQLTALDLYERGMNVFPIKPHDKKPYLLKPLFVARLHHCSVLCNHSSPRQDITELFQRDNLAVMTGRTSGNLIGIDCDSLAAFDQMGADLTARALPFWAITGRRGGVYLMRVIEGEVTNTPKDKSIIKDVEIWGNRHLIVLPPSIHPSGVVYQWATPEPRYHLPAGATIPAVSIAALDWLGVSLAKNGKRWEEPELFNLPQWAEMLSYTNRETLAGYGVSEGNRNTKLFAALCDLKAHDVNYHEAEQLAREYCQRTGLDVRGAMDTLKSAYSIERTPANRSRGGDRVREWQRAQAFAESFDWRGTFGRKARTLKACYLACIDRARLDGRLHFRATCREIGERMQTDAKRAAEYLHALAEAGFIKRTGYKDAGIYRLLKLSELPTVCTTGSYSVGNLELPKTQGEQDAFSYLGLTAWYVWRYLLQHEAKNGAQLAKALNLPSSSVYVALKLLQDANVRLVSSAEGKLYGEPRTEASLQSFAFAQFDGASPSQARKERNQLDRELNANRAIRKARVNWQQRQAESC